MRSRHGVRLPGLAMVAVGVVALAGCVSAQTVRPPKYDHVVVVVEENHSYEDIVGNTEAPYMNALASQGALFADAYGVEHPSQPNYLDLFSGSNQGVTNDSCPHDFSAPNLASSLLQAGKTFIGFSEDLPSIGYTGCASGTYRRKHNPWVDFANVPHSVNLPMRDFPNDYAKLPTVSFVIPGLETDMHDGTIAAADAWLKTNLSGYLDWAMNHDSLLVITWDESEGSAGNHIPLIIAGAGVEPGIYGGRVDHYSLLRLLEEMYDLPLIGGSASANPIDGIWK